MKLDVKAMAIAFGIWWGVLGIFLVGLINLIWPPYGQAWLEMMASIYPGYTATASIGQVIVGSVDGIVCGAICGAILAWLYNRFAKA
ncbi:MAG: hypothetical protein V3U60_02865 [Gammaproteobacteria bacterium]